MGEFSLLHWLVVLAIVVLLFGAGKVPRVMGDLAKGIKAFKSAMKEDDADETQFKSRSQAPRSNSTPGSESPIQDRDRAVSANTEGMP